MTSHSQAGEDLIVAKQFPAGFTGCLLEVGAWDPVTFSNSRLFIEGGWSAVLCEFSPGPVRSLVQAYPSAPVCRVAVVCAAITVTDENVQMYCVTDDAVSSSDPSTLKTWKERGGYYGNLYVPTLPLDKLLSQFFGDRKLDYASIDTEGTSVDLAIALLQSEHRPNVLCCEHDGRIVELMAVAQELGYVAVHTNNTNIIVAGRW